MTNLTKLFGATGTCFGCSKGGYEVTYCGVCYHFFNCQNCSSNNNQFVQHTVVTQTSTRISHQFSSMLNSTIAVPPPAKDTENAEARLIARVLQEPNVPIITKLVHVVGIAKAHALLSDTAMEFRKGTQRTPGGMFLHLAKKGDKFTVNEKLEIFKRK